MASTGRSSCNTRLWLKEVVERQSRPVDLPAAPGAAGDRRARRADLLSGAVLDPDRIRDRHSRRHRLGGVARRRKVDQTVSGGAMLAASIPSFWLGLMFIQLFSVRMGWFPVAGYGDPGASLAARLYHLVLPATVLGIVNSALITRFTRASMLDVLSEDFVRTARAKGLPETRIVLRHALGNALVPIITVVGLTAALLVGGAIVTETVFGLPGIGNLVVSAVLRRDYPVIQGALIVIAGVYVLINFAIDVIYTLVDPRVKT
jgi:peptide/nickel transport system permease protein